MHKSGRTVPPAYLIAYQPAIRISLLKQDDARQLVNKKPQTVLAGCWKTLFFGGLLAGTRMYRHFRWR